MKIKFSLGIVAVLYFACGIFGQKSLPDFNRAQTFDAQHYEIHVSFDRAKKEVFGDTTVTLAPLKNGFRVVELDAVGLKFSSVTLAGTDKALRYTASGSMVKVTLDRTYATGEVVSIRLKYTAFPKKGVYFENEDVSSTLFKHSAQIWSQGEADEARHWFPSFDFPSDKATTEEYITAESPLTVIGNGEFLGKTDTGDGKSTWHYKMPVPHSTYLVSFVIGDYLKIDDKFGSIPLAYYTYPGTEKPARLAFKGTPDMIAKYQKLTGVAFPYNKYDQTLVANFQFGGMENITATTMADTEILSGLSNDTNTNDLVSHELAHSWFGDMVTCRNWAELWLNESFATYMEAAYREQVNGREDYLQKLRFDAFQFRIDDETTKRRHGLFNRLAGDVGKLFDVSAVTYNKGGVVIHMLREQVGTEAFWRGINAYLNEHKFGNVETTDLRRAMETSSGQDLGWFFDQWVYGVGAPTLSWRQTYIPSSHTLRLTVTQTQSPMNAKPATYRLPMEVAFMDDGTMRTEKIDITKRVQIFNIRVSGQPTEMKFDPDEKLMLVITKETGTKTLQ